MMKKLALAVGVAAALGGASVAHAGYYETFKNFTGEFAITNIADGTVGQFDINLTNLNGGVSIQVPVAGNYGIEALAGTTGWIDYNGVPGPDLGKTFLTTTNIGYGFVSLTGLAPTTKTVDFAFNNAANTHSVSFNGGPGITTALPGAVTLSGFLASSFFTPFGITSPINGPVGLTFNVVNDSIALHVTSLDLETAFLQLDNLPAGNPLGLPAGNKDGRIDGTFSVNGSVHIPEPASLALVGLGLAGLAARRRKVKAA